MCVVCVCVSVRGCVSMCVQTSRVVLVSSSTSTQTRSVVIVPLERSLSVVECCLKTGGNFQLALQCLCTALPAAAAIVAVIRSLTLAANVLGNDMTSHDVISCRELRVSSLSLLSSHYLHLATSQM